MTNEAQDEVTRLLAAIQSGDAEASARLVEHVYEYLHQLAAGLMLHERADHSLQPTALLHEALIRLLGDGLLAHAPNRAYLFGAAARAMRQVLAEHARRRRAEKRGGNVRRLPFDSLLDHFEEQHLDVVAVRDALDTLAARHERASQVLTLRMLGGFRAAEVAEQLGVSLATVEKDTRFARAWLKQLLQEDDDDSN